MFSFVDDAIGAIGGGLTGPLAGVAGDLLGGGSLIDAAGSLLSGGLGDLGDLGGLAGCRLGGAARRRSRWPRRCRRWFARRRPRRLLGQASSVIGGLGLGDLALPPQGILGDCTAAGSATSAAGSDNLPDSIPGLGGGFELPFGLGTFPSIPDLTGPIGAAGGGWLGPDRFSRPARSPSSWAAEVAARRRSRTRSPGHGRPAHRGRGRSARHPHRAPRRTPPTQPACRTSTTSSASSPASATCDRVGAGEAAVAGRDRQPRRCPRQPVEQRADPARVDHLVAPVPTVMDTVTGAVDDSRSAPRQTWPEPVATTSVSTPSRRPPRPRQMHREPSSMPTATAGAPTTTCRSRCRRDYGAPTAAGAVEMPAPVAAGARAVRLQSGRRPGRRRRGELRQHVRGPGVTGTSAFPGHAGRAGASLALARMAP